MEVGGVGVVDQHAVVDTFYHVEACAYRCEMRHRRCYFPGRPVEIKHQCQTVDCILYIHVGREWQGYHASRLKIIIRYLGHRSFLLD